MSQVGYNTEFWKLEEPPKPKIRASVVLEYPDGSTMSFILDVTHLEGKIAEAELIKIHGKLVTQNNHAEFFLPVLPVQVLPVPDSVAKPTRQIIKFGG